MKGTSVTIYKAKNGWRVNYDWEEKDAKGDTEYRDEDYVFATLEEAMLKVKELVALIN